MRTGVDQPDQHTLISRHHYDPQLLVSIWGAEIFLNENSMLAQASMRTFDRYAMVYTLSGRCTYVHADLRVQHFRAGDLFFVFPDIPHRYFTAPGDHWKQLWVTFNGRVFDAWRAAGAMSPERFWLHLAPVSAWVERIKSVLFQFDLAMPRQLLSAQCAIQSLLAEILSNDSRSADLQAADRWLLQAQSLLSSVQRADALDLVDIAGRMNCSYANFRRKFSALAGVAPAQYHARLLMRRACHILSYEKTTNRELADQLGFSSEFHFSKRFRQVIGMTTKAFRQVTPQLPEQ